MMLGIAVFVLHASSEVVSAPNLQFPCINHFRHAFQSENIMVIMFQYYVIHCL